MVNHLHYRRALPDDAAACIDLRGRTRENAFSAAQLAELGITEDSWAAGIRDDALPGHSRIGVGRSTDSVSGSCASRVQRAAVHGRG